jgi:peroxiredoxin
VKTSVLSAKGAKEDSSAENNDDFADSIISRLQRSGSPSGFHLGRWPRLLHFAPSALEPPVFTQSLSRTVPYPNSGIDSEGKALERGVLMKTLLLGTLLLVGSVSAGAQSSKPVAVLALKDIHGREFNLRNYRGKVVLLNFWATWCQPCRTEIPDLIKKQREYRSRGLQIIGITYPPEKISEVRRFTRKLRMNYPVAMGTKETKNLFTSSETLPMTLVIDREGIVRHVIEGIMYQDEFEQKVQPLLSGKVARPLIEPPGS